MRKRLSLIATAGLVLAAGCHHGPPKEAPTPQPTEAELARSRQIRDSIDAANRAVAAAAERDRQMALANRARADSIERIRIAEQAAARQAAATNTELRTELGVMVHFRLAAADVRPEDRAALDRKVTILKANPGVRLRITGACDERGSDRYNMALGTRRAMAVKEYLVGKGIDAGRLDQVSSGEGSPLDAGSTEPAWARNRRAEFLVVSGDMLLSMK